jgi:His/Glu/Gln/Arg/opine family amino acid ABC transporter permease subunit
MIDSLTSPQMIAIFTQLLTGLLTTVEIFVLTLVFSLPTGLLVAFGRMSKNTLLRWIFKVYISIMRGTPLILQIMFVYFGPYFIFGIKISNTYRFYAVIIAFVLNYAAYFAEIYRGGIESMPLSSHESAQVLGFSKSQTFMRIILPQVVKRILPPVTNEVITLVKDTSLAYVIAVTEMFTAASSLASSQSSVLPFLIAGIFYYIFNYAVAFAMERCEKGFSYYR